MDADEFYTQAVDPAFPDEMIFQIRAENPKNPGTFSREGLTDTVDMMDAFIMARIMGQWKKTARPPKAMRMHLKIMWDADPDIEESYLPWFDGTLREGPTQLDGKHRVPRR